jgi:hypothetical protein
MTIEAVKLEIPRAKARDLYKQYKVHQHYSKPIDREIQRAYQLIAQGRMVIKALASVSAAGLDEQGRPKLAICRADAERCFYRGWMNGAARFSMDSWPRSNTWRRTIELPTGFFPTNNKHQDLQAMLPIVPIHLRPKRGMANYHVLWEAEWSPIPPKDPLLLRRIGHGDMWLVLAAWDLTEVERAALDTRLNG